MRDPIHEAAIRLREQKDEILDLFCKSFILSREPLSMDDLRDIFDNYVLEIKLVSATHWEYGLKLKEGD